MAKNELVSLALLTVAPLHAYAISAVVDQMGMEHWAQVSRASLYAALSRLEKRGAVAVHTEKVDNMPERKVYSITAEGSAMFHEELFEAIAKVNKNDATLFHLAVNFFIGATPQEGITWANDRLTALRFGEKHLGEQHNHLSEECCASGLITIRAAQKIVAAEITATEEFITLLETKPDFYKQYHESFRQQLTQNGSDVKSCNNFS